MKVLIDVDTNEVLYKYYDLKTSKEEVGHMPNDIIGEFAILDVRLKIIVGDIDKNYITFGYTLNKCESIRYFSIPMKYMKSFVSLLRRYHKSVFVYNISLYKRLLSIKCGDLKSKLKLDYNTSFITAPNSVLDTPNPDLFIVIALLCKNSGKNIDDAVNLILREFYDLRNNLNIDSFKNNKETYVTFLVSRSWFIHKSVSIDLGTFIDEVYR